jgi:hypothetical protein
MKNMDVCIIEAFVFGLEAEFIVGTGFIYPLHHIFGRIKFNDFSFEISDNIWKDILKKCKASIVRGNFRI